VNRVKARHLAPDGDPYAVLGLPSGASMDKVRKRWRSLAAEYHPDRLVARGVPVAFIATATDRLASINAAYQAISRLNT